VADGLLVLEQTIDLGPQLFDRRALSDQLAQGLHGNRILGSRARSMVTFHHQLAATFVPVVASVCF
jgi:hypothetical protein